ncbi:MAG TPA: glycosyltransferase family 9 protein [Burkholderiales bacterium]
MKFWFKSGAWATRRARRIVGQLVPENIRRIGVIRHAALGDMVLTRPFLLELRRHFPNAAITLSIVSNYTRGTPEDLVDRVHTAYGNDRKDVPLRRQVARARELGEQDLLFDLAASVRSFWVCALNRARLKIGFPYHAVQRPLFYDATVHRSDFRFEADVMLDMLNLLGLRTEFPLRYALPGEPLARPRPYVLYFAGASSPEKCWPAERFGDLIRRMTHDYPAYDHLVLEGRAQWESAQRLLAPFAGVANVERIVSNDLDETIALVKGARLLVSNDTGIRNLGIAAEIPTVGIFFATSPFLYWPRAPIHDNVFNADGSPPSVDAVHAAARAILAR